MAHCADTQYPGLLLKIKNVKFQLSLSELMEAGNACLSSFFSVPSIWPISQAN